MPLLSLRPPKGGASWSSPKRRALFRRTFKMERALRRAPQ
nr:MAG TPA: hypothetical protein [Caudoviricetes sp.]